MLQNNVSTYVVVTAHNSPNLIHFFFESDPFTSFFCQGCDCLSTTLSNARKLYDKSGWNTLLLGKVIFKVTEYAQNWVQDKRRIINYKKIVLCRSVNLVRCHISISDCGYVFILLRLF